MTKMVYNQILAQYQAQIQQNSKSLAAVVNMVHVKGDQEFQTGNYGEAAEWYKRAIAIDPQDSQAPGKRQDAIEKWLK